jgi:uncharacterized protein YyaL (SSP411 family)
MAKGYQVLGDERFLTAALEAGEFILSSMSRKDGLLHVYAKGESSIPAYLDDYAQVANAFVDLYESTFDTRWLVEASRLTDNMIHSFWDEENGGFFLTSDKHRDLLVRTRPFYDGSLPSGNATAALALLRLGKLLDRSSYAETAQQLLATAAGLVSRSPQGFPYVLRGVDLYLHPSREIALVGAAGSPDMRALLDTVHGRFVGNLVLAFLDPERSDAAEIEKLIPLLAGKKEISGKATAYVCENFACKAPVTNPDDLVGQLGPRTRYEGDPAGG